MRPALRLVVFAVHALALGVRAADGDGPISADSRELPPPPTPPPLTRDAPAADGMQALSYRVTFFPPTAPVFGASIAQYASVRTTVSGRPVYPPEELADCVNEWFYPPLGTRLFEGHLGEKPAQRLAAYRATRASLLNDLQNELTVTAAFDAAARENELREFARVQTPRIVALENEADQLRADLIHGGWFGSGANWNDGRGWHLGAGSATSSVPANFGENAEFQVLRATAFYQAGLTPEQRGLLQELAMDLGEKNHAARLPPQATLPRDPLVIYFSPETSRFSLPGAVTPELHAKLGTFNHDKDVLKRELHDAVVAQDRSSAAKRTKVFSELADQQWPRLKALAELAEAIRHDLAARPPPPPPWLPPRLPPGLADRIELHQRARSAIEQERADARWSVFSTPIHLPDNLAALSPQERNDRAFAAIRERVARLQQADADFRGANAERYDALARSLKSINDDLTAVAQSQIDPATGQPMDVPALMRSIDSSNQLFDKIGREEAIYRDYRTAMLEPGLSPEQRRLLFGSALVGLAQPLPSFDRMPGPRFLPVW